MCISPERDFTKHIWRSHTFAPQGKSLLCVTLTTYWVDYKWVYLYNMYTMVKVYEPPCLSHMCVYMYVLLDN